MTSAERDAGRPDEWQEPSARTEDTEDAPKAPRSKRKPLPLWQESILLLVMAMLLAIVVKQFFAQAFYIPSQSMEPGLLVNDRIMVQKVSYWAGEPERGDVVVFKDPGGWLPDSSDPAANPLTKAMTKVGLYPSGGHLVKRVVGVAGDVIECCDDDGNLKVNGVSIDESGYVKDDPLSECNGPMIPGCDWKTDPVPDGKLFVMGDNRANSGDSSRHMCRAEEETDCVAGREFVSTDLVVGKLGVVIWPWKHMRVEHQPDSFDDVPDGKK